MSKVWICKKKTADIPFLLEEQRINLYSFEELCYYLYHNVDVIEESFFDEKLLVWLEQELNLNALCGKLREGIAQGQKWFWCMEEILWESGYYTKKELETVQETVSRMIQARPEERRKLRADKMLLEGKYKRAVREYQQLLLQDVPDRLLESKIWHNMGTAYARQFLFERAAECYERAYTMGRMEESRQQYLTACACAEGENLGEEIIISKDEKLKLVREQEGMIRYEAEMYQRLEQLAEEYMRSE